MLRVFTIVSCLVFVSLPLVNDASGQEWRFASGYRALEDEIGAGIEDGTGVDVSMIESPTGDEDAYRPDYSNTEFTDRPVNFIDGSGSSTGTSGHANVVGEDFYGGVSSIASGITNVTLYEANQWLNTVTGLEPGTNPESQPFGVQNHSYIGNDAPVGAVLNLLRRADHMSSQSDMVMVVGTSNSASEIPQFMAPGFNLLSVGRTDGQHGFGLTTFYRPGRTRPHIVSSNGATSFGAPTVASTAAILRQAGSGTNADHAEVIRAIILAGATKSEFETWNNSPNRPLDTRFGVGELNVYNSYKIFQSGETDGETSLPTMPTGISGWDFGPIQPNENLNYLIELKQPSDHISIVLNWDNTIIDSNPSPTDFSPVDSLANLDLVVVGPMGLVESVSINQNVEHVYVRNAPAGQYFFIVSGDSATGQTVDFGLAWRTAVDDLEVPESVNVVNGAQKIGNLSDLNSSDDQYVGFRPVNGENKVVVEFEGSTSLNWVNALSLDLESRVTTPNLIRKVEFYDFLADEYRYTTFSSQTLGRNYSGVAVQDSATGIGYLMYTQQPVYSRFPTANRSNASQVIAVRVIAGIWQYNDDSQWIVFEPAPTDRLLALVDFTNDTVLDLQGPEFEVSGIKGGYLSGDFEFIPNQFGGEPNNGEFGVVGSNFVTSPFDLMPNTDHESEDVLYREPYRYVDRVSRKVRVRVTWEATGPVFMYPWTVFVDRAVFTVSK